MSQKVHVKSLRTRLWGSNVNNWYAEKNMVGLWANFLCYRVALSQYYNKGLSLKVFKARNKRRLRKPVLSVSNMPVSVLGNLFLVRPVLSLFPRKGLTAKYIPYNTVRGKRRVVSVLKKRLQRKKNTTVKRLTRGRGSEALA